MFSRLFVPDDFDVLPGFVPLNPTGINWPISNDNSDNNDTYMITIMMVVIIMITIIITVIVIIVIITIIMVKKIDDVYYNHNINMTWHSSNYIYN